MKDLIQIENKLIDNLEDSLNKLENNFNPRELIFVETDLKFLRNHIEGYGSHNIEKYCELVNKYNQIIGVMR
ncbi:MAG: hypothetical protein M0R17_09525 [Candidatus Omnitrophica bacterium]|jgi:hypothetical protein|nr:hypothetical protein [Candidatus Omnitrophota bacterium]